MTDRGRLRIIAVGVLGGLLVATGVTWATMRPAPDSRGDRSLLADGPTRTIAGQVALTDSLRSFDRTVRIDARDEGLVLDRTELTCHDGRAHVTWHVGNLEPTNPATGIHLSARLDGRVIGSILAGSTDGIWNDRPANIEAVADCPAGRHVLDIEVSGITGEWAVPYVANPPTVDPRLRVNRGFVVTEVY